MDHRTGHHGEGDGCVGQVVGIGAQGVEREGLTCDFLELLYSAGGAVVSRSASEIVPVRPAAAAARRV